MAAGRFSRTTVFQVSGSIQTAPCSWNVVPSTKPATVTSVRLEPKPTVSPASMPSSANERSNQASPVAGGAGTRSFGAS